MRSRMVRFASRLTLIMMITAMFVFGGMLVLTNENESFAQQAHYSHNHAHHTNQYNHYNSQRGYE